jgi:hypothetical protein
MQWRHPTIWRPKKLYRNNLTQDFVPDIMNGSTVYPMSAVPVGLGDQVDGIAQQYFTTVQVSRTSGNGDNFHRQHSGLR